MIKNIIFIVALTVASPSFAGEVCNVTLCNKLKRVTISPWNMVKDKIGEVCFDAVVDKEDAVAGKTLASESRWYQGSFNPTKRSVVFVKTVHSCGVAGAL